MDPANIFEVIETGSVEAFVALLTDDATQAQQRSDSGVSVLLYTYYLKQPEMTKCLLASGDLVLDVFDASAAGDVARLRELATEDPSCVQDQAADGFYPLHLACFFAGEEAVEFLLEHGADANALGAAPANLRPLHSAVAASKLESTRLLLAHGANPNQVQQGGWTPLHAAANHGQLELVELLLEHGALPSLVADAGKTAAELARDGGHEAIAVLLEER